MITTPAALRQLMLDADNLPDLSAAAWNKCRDANQALSNWRTWLPGLLDAAYPQPAASADPRMCQAEAEARGLI